MSSFHIATILKLAGRHLTPCFRSGLLVGVLVTKGFPDFLPVMRESQKRGDREEEQDKVESLERTKGALFHPYS